MNGKKSSGRARRSVFPGQGYLMVSITIGLFSEVLASTILQPERDHVMSYPIDITVNHTRCSGTSGTSDMRQERWKARHISWVILHSFNSLSTSTKLYHSLPRRGFLLLPKLDSPTPPETRFICSIASIITSVLSLKCTAGSLGVFDHAYGFFCIFSCSSVCLLMF